MESRPPPARAVPTQVGRYATELALGEGPIARTLLGRDPRIGRPVAIRVLRDDLPLSPEARAQLAERVRDRVRVAGAFSHPAMVVLHDMGDDPRAGPYFVYELLAGPTLRDALGKGPIPRLEVARVARAIGSALSMAHAAGVVHGNLKPDNIALAPGGPKLTGAGFGTVGGPPFDDARDGAERPPLDASAAPELLAGAPPSPATDQFSLAATLYEALTGRPPFIGSDRAEVASVVASAKHPAPTSVLPELRACPHLDTIFDRALAKDAHRRFPACDAFTSALAGSLEASQSRIETPTSQGAPASLTSIIPRATRRWQNAAAASAILVICALILVGRQPHGEGVSLKSVAGAFAMTLAMPPRPPPHVRQAPPVSSAGPDSANAATPYASPSGAGVPSAMPPVTAAPAARPAGAVPPRSSTAPATVADAAVP